MTITARVSRRPVTDEKVVQAVNKEIVPAVVELIAAMNALPDTSDHEARIEALETLTVTHESRLDTDDTRLGALEATSADHETRIAALETALPTLTVETISGTTYTLVLADAWKLKQTTNGSAVTVTVPTNASVAFPIGTQVNFEQNGAGTMTLVGAGGVTLNARVGLSSAGQYGALTATKTATDRWLVTGDQA